MLIYFVRMARLGTGTYLYVAFKSPDPVQSSVTAGPVDPIVTGVPRSVTGAEEQGEVSVNKPSPFFCVAVTLIVCSLL